MDKQNGKIVKGVGGKYTVLCADGVRITARARGAFRHEQISPEVGDDVTRCMRSDSSAATGRMRTAV